MEKKTLYIIIMSLILLFVVSLFWNYKQYRDMKEQPISIKEVKVVKYVEKKDSLPTAKEEKDVGTIKIPIPKKVPEPSDLPLDSSEIVSETVDSIELEITQKVYSDSLYKAYVSGYMPSLDSIFVRQKEITRTITETRTIEKKEFRRWNIGLIGGYGYGFQSNTFEPFIGIGITISLFK